MDFVEQYGPWGLIIGGSEGTGAAFARQLAERGLNLALVARSPGPLAGLADELRSSFPDRQVRTLSADLSTQAGAEAVQATFGDLDVGLLIYNAGACSQWKHFLDADIDFAVRLTLLNSVNMMRVAHDFGRPMKSRGHGGILVVGSGAMMTGLGGLATYSASKAFSSLFSEGLWHELRPFGVHVLGYIVGQTNTPAMARYFPGAIAAGADPREVAMFGLANLANGPTVYAAGVEERMRTVQHLSRKEAVELRMGNTAAFNAEKADQTP